MVRLDFGQENDDEEWKWRICTRKCYIWHKNFLIHVLCMINLAKTHIWNNKSVTPVCILYVTNTCQDIQPWGIKDMSETLSHKGNFWKDCYFRENSSEAVVPI